MEAPDIKLLISLKPDEIIQWYKRKGYYFSWNWQDTWQDAHTKAFTVAKAMRLDILSDIRSEVQKALDEGISFNQFKENLKPTLKAKGWWGKVKAIDVPSDVKLPEGIDPEKEVQLGSPYRLKTIYRTNMKVAYSAGHYKNMIDNIKDRPYWMYNAVLDQNTRPSHRALHGKVYRADDPVWDKIYPPNDWNCRCSVIPLDNDDLEEMNLKVEETSPKDPLGSLPKSFKIGDGWDYNVGKAFLNFDTDFGNFKIYPHQKSHKDYGLPPAKQLHDDEFIKSPELINPTSDNLYDIIKDEFGLDDKTSTNRIHTKDKNEVFISLQDFNYLIDKKDQRIKFLKLIKPTLENPFESYLALYQSGKGFVEYRRHYIGLYQDKSKRKFLVVVNEKKDSLVIWNVFPARNIDSYRKGELIYKRK